MWYVIAYTDPRLLKLIFCSCKSYDMFLLLLLLSFGFFCLFFVSVFYSIVVSVFCSSLFVRHCFVFLVLNSILVLLCCYLFLLIRKELSYWSC